LEAAIVEMARFESRVVLTELLQQLGVGPQPDDTGAGARGSSPAPGRSTSGSPPSRRGPSPRAEANVVDMTARLAPAAPADDAPSLQPAPAPSVTPSQQAAPAAAVAEFRPDRISPREEMAPRRATLGASAEWFAAGGPPPGAPARGTEDAALRAASAPV